MFYFQYTGAWDQDNAVQQRIFTDSSTGETCDEIVKTNSIMAELTQPAPAPTLSISTTDMVPLVANQSQM